MAGGSKRRKMHSAEREETILRQLSARGFIPFTELSRAVAASPASLRRDLTRLQKLGKLVRVHGGARLPKDDHAALSGIPVQESVSKNTRAKAAIGKAAAKLCEAGEAIVIDGGSTTLQMCQHIDGLNLQVLSNSLYIINALMPQGGTRISVPAGELFRQQNIILSPYADDGMDSFHASKLFIGAAAVGRRGLMQADTVLIQSERRFLERADKIVLLADSTKFNAPTGYVLCPLEEVDIIITDSGIRDGDRKLVEKAGVKLIIAGG